MQLVSISERGKARYEIVVMKNGEREEIDGVGECELERVPERVHGERG